MNLKKMNIENLLNKIYLNVFIIVLFMSFQNKKAIMNYKLSL
jgi:hypothetical protein